MIGVGGLYRYYRACMETMTINGKVYIGSVPDGQTMGWCRFCGDPGSAHMMCCGSKPCMSRMEMTVLTDLLGKKTMVELSGTFQSASVDFKKLSDALISFASQLDKAKP